MPEPPERRRSDSLKRFQAAVRAVTATQRMRHDIESFTPYRTWTWVLPLLDVEGREFPLDALARRAGERV
eukprot:CAMPEP_0185207198 /NCGR_PEP_ID=MMETSP1140-20130426/59906_1 /TAXON_ID=298111 /ORGANISM="Pavlova sp., Strain CCMP459" /LENGTH=69 /DNA_ID=CAMNT_0027774875 /DNA_START=125 /DNA_END=331 /DNA_ORIENTATION=-